MTATLLRLEYKPTIPAYLLLRLENAYKTYSTVVRSAEIALNAAHDISEISDLIAKLRSVDRQIKEMLIGQASKGAPVNIGGEQSSLVDTLNDNDSSVAMVRKATAKKLARRLYRLHHPDAGGSVSMFNTVRKAANEGDLETLLFFRLKEGVDSYSEADVVTLQKKIEIKTTQFKGRPSWQIASAFYSNRELYVKKYVTALEKKIHELNMQMFGMTTPANSLGDMNDRS